MRTALDVAAALTFMTALAGAGYFTRAAITAARTDRNNP